jgi:hypothetical protein
MREEALEVVCSPRVNGGEVVAQQQRKTGPFESGAASALVVKQAQLRGEADVGEAEGVSDEKLALR